MVTQLGNDWFKCFKDWNRECVPKQCVRLCCPGVGERDLTTAKLVGNYSVLEQGANSIKRRVPYLEFTIDACDYHVDCKPTEPVCGDILKWEGCIYEVRAVDDKPHQQWHGIDKCTYVVRAVYCQREDDCD